MPTAVVLSTHDLGAWAEGPDDRPGGSMPYGMQHLGLRFDLRWSDRQARGAWQNRASRIVAGAGRRVAPGLQGLLGAAYALPLLHEADAVLSVFENAGLGFARLRLHATRAARVPHVMLTCWLAEDCQSMPSAHIRSLRRSLEGGTELAVFSTNQVDILSDVLHLDPAQCHVVPFGVDTAFYDPARVDEPAGGGGVVAVGSDSRRDYRTLLEAVRLADIPLTLLCRPRNLEGLVIAPQVDVRYNVYNEEYRRVLHKADLVVTPTSAPAYPSGQSVVLEAMSLGRPTLTTDSPAMRDYVEDGRTGALVPAGDPDALAHALTDLMGDCELRRRLAGEGQKSVRREFALSNFWEAVAKVMRQAG